MIYSREADILNFLPGVRKIRRLNNLWPVIYQASLTVTESQIARPM